MVVLLGNLTRDPELKTTPSGAQVCNVGLAVNRKYKKKDGGEGEEVLFITVVMWSRLAETVAKYCRKGYQVLVQGRLTSRSWEKDGVKRTAIELQAATVQFLGRPKGASSEGEAAPAELDGETPKDWPQGEHQPTGGTGGGDDEVPF